MKLSHRLEQLKPYVFVEISRIIAEKRAAAALLGSKVEVRTCWHPSPASPLANKNGGKDWRENVRSVLP